MIRRFISIRNVGRFRNSAAAGNPELRRVTLVSGANGSGKTTLCAVLRSLRNNDPSYLVGRKTLGTPDQISVEFLLTTGLVRFNGVTWSAGLPQLAIFDGTFIAENVHSGEAGVELDQRRNLYRVMIGEQGVRLADEETRLAAESRAKSGELLPCTTAIQRLLPQGLNVVQFLALPADAEIDAKIQRQRQIVDAVRVSEQIRNRPQFAQYNLPPIPEAVFELLGRTIDDIAQDAEQQVARHLAGHGMEAEGGNWIAHGLDYAKKETCPFCGQVITGLALMGAYRSIFSDSYRKLRADVAEIQATVETRLGERALGDLNAQHEQNLRAFDFWRNYAGLGDLDPSLPNDVIESARRVRNAISALLVRKTAAPLDRIAPDDEFNQAARQYADTAARADAINATLNTANEAIRETKVRTGAVDAAGANAELARLQATRTRHTEPAAGLCARHAALSAEKIALEERKEAVRADLENHTAAVLRPYEGRINDYLDSFNAGFRIAETRHVYPGGSVASIYRLVINNTVVDIGDGRTPNNIASFKNTLSVGDRSTLALAFFLAEQERDPNRANKVLVLDDPFSSQDAFRRRQTVHEIYKASQYARQVIVLSHDVPFLKQIWDKAAANERVALALADHRAQGTKIVEIDLVRACQGRTANDMDDLQAFLSTGAGVLIDLVRKMRVVLETYCWTTYPASFLAGQDWLGEVIRKTREGGDQHPAHALLDELNQINNYISQYYHGEDLANVVPDQIDPGELTGYVRRTLRIVNALQA